MCRYSRLLPSWRAPWVLPDSTRAALTRRPPGQVHEKVLRLHLQGAIRAAAEAEVDRPPGHLVHHVRAVAKLEAEEQHHALEPLGIDFLAAVERIEDLGGIAVEPRVPAPARIFDALRGLDR